MTRSMIVVVAIAMVYSTVSVCADEGHFGPATAQFAIDTSVKESKDWKRVRSANFEALGDADTPQMETILSALETFRSVLAEMFPRIRLTSPVPTVLVLIKKDSEFSRFKPRDDRGRRRNNLGGYFLEGGDINYIVLPVGDQAISKPVQITIHEYIHYISSINPSLQPVWLKEGISELYQTFEYDLEQKVGLVGRPPAGLLESLNSRKLLPLAQVLGWAGANKLIRSEKTIYVFYAESWALVHYLTIGRPGWEKAPLAAYLNAIEQGVSIERAFLESFGVTLGEMEKELTLYIQRSSFPGRSLQPTLESIPKASLIEHLVESEALYVQGDLLARLGINGDGEKKLARALKIDSSYTKAQIALGVIRSNQERYEEALELIRPISERDKTNFRSHLELGRIYRKTEQLDKALLAYRRATDANAASTAGWLERCIVAMELGKEGESDAALLRLEAIDPNPKWIDARSLAAYHANLLDITTRDARVYIDRVGRESEHSPYSAFLGAIAYWHLGKAPEAAALLEEIRPELTPDTWQVDVMDFMQGRTSGDWFLSRAKDNEERTEAHAYIGIKASLAGHRNDAVKHLQWVRKHGTKTYMEYAMAETELKWLNTAAPAPVH